MENMNLEDMLRNLKKHKTYQSYTLVSNYYKKNRDAQAHQPLLRIAILRNFTIEPLLPVLEGELLMEGFQPEIYIGNFDNIAQEILDQESSLYDFKPDVVVMALWLEMLAPEIYRNYPQLDKEGIELIVDRLLSNLECLITKFREKSKAPLLINNFPITHFPSLSILAAQREYSVTSIILRINNELIKLVAKYNNIYIVDYFNLFSRFGHNDGVDKRYWFMSSAPIGKNLLLPIGQEYIKFIKTFKGKIRKCLVLDCDETLWGGIVGESGLHGIKLGADYPGLCYQSFQYEILNLYNNGIILALCSKNNEGDVLEVLQHHPYMILKEEHFATWQINWDDKPSNIRRIAMDLNIGLDSIVFVDDSEFECNLVREHLPQVEVIQLSESPSGYQDALRNSGAFTILTLTEEDKIRNKTYKANIHRKKIHEASNSIEDYLEKLELEIDIGLADTSIISRISQMTQKTNQFNLTTYRYSEGDILDLINSKEADVFYLKVTDNISDMGIVGAAIIKYDDDVANIDTFLMSCRVIGRNVEFPFMYHILEWTRRRGCNTIIGKYIPTLKNQQVALLYEKFGFKQVYENSKDSWSSNINDINIPVPKYIKVNKNNLC